MREEGEEGMSIAARVEQHRNLPAADEIALGWASKSTLQVV